jgi:hypothetical protein
VPSAPFHNELIQSNNAWEESKTGSIGGGSKGQGRPQVIETNGLDFINDERERGGSSSGQQSGNGSINIRRHNRSTLHKFNPIQDYVINNAIGNLPQEIAI